MGEYGITLYHGGTMVFILVMDDEQPFVSSSTQCSAANLAL